MINHEPVSGLFRRILTEMVAHPEHLDLGVRALSASVSFSLRAHAADTPLLIGEGAANYRALMTLAVAMGGKAGYRVSMGPIREPEFGKPSFYRFQPRQDWPRDRLRKLLDDVVGAIFIGEHTVEVDDNDAGGMTTWEVFVQGGQKPGLTAAVGPAIGRIFDAMGKSNGRLLAVDLLQSLEPLQPDTAAGRYVDEIDQ